MHEIRVLDRDGGEERLPVRSGQSVGSALLGARIPPTSVVVTADGSPVSDAHRIDPDREYEALLLEGYDLASIRSLFETADADGAAAVDRRVSFANGGELSASTAALSPAEHESSVEAKLLDTLTYHDLVTEGDVLVVGASGGLDSTTLLRILARIRPDLPEFELVAVTVADFIPVEDARPPEDVAATVESLGFRHRHVEAGAIEETYDLTCSPTEALRAVEASDREFALGSVAPNVVQHMLERTARAEGADAVCVGAHATELLGGILNAWFTGAETQRRPIPAHPVGELEYRYPLAYLTKRDLFRYRHARTGATRRTKAANPWDWFADEQHFYYYLADMLQTVWPGCEYWIYESHNDRVETDAAVAFDPCDNCGKRKRATDLSGDGRCDVCLTFDAVDRLAR